MPLRLAALAVVLVSLPSCGAVSINLDNGVQGSGRTVTNELDLADFTRVSAGGAFRVDITQGARFKVELTADDNLIEYADVTKSGDTLRIQTKRNVSIRNPTRWQVAVTMPELAGLDLSGATHTTIAGFNSDKPFDAKLSGASALTGTLKAGDTRFGVSGASKVEICGSAEKLRVNASGASRASLGDFASKDASVEASGASSIIVSASGKLNADASGASSIRYLGQPASVETKTSGASSVRQK